MRSLTTMLRKTSAFISNEVSELGDL